MGLFYGKRICNRVADTKKCRQKIEKGECVCIKKMQIPPYPIVRHPEGCLMVIKKIKGTVLLCKKDKKIIFFSGSISTKKNLFPGWK